MTIKKLILVFALLAAGLGFGPDSEASWSELSPALEASLVELSSSSPDSLVDVIIFLNPREALSRVKQISSSRARRSEKVKSVIANLKGATVSGIENIRYYLNEKSAAPVREFWITPALTARLNAEQINRVSDMESVKLITEDVLLSYIEPVEVKDAPSMATANSTQLSALGVPQLWSRGLTGAGRLVCSFDTGVESDHPALSSKWRGNHASLVSSWYSPVSPNNPPTDNIGHGTHTMGIMVGSTPADTFGVAPGAEWITGGVVDQGRSLSVTLADIVAAFQWALNPDGDINTTDDVPDVILNSWGIPKNMFVPCDSTFNGVVEAVEAAGIVTIFAAGNEGPNPMTIRSPADNAVTPINTFSVGAVDDNRVVASFSSRGPSSCNSTDKKPEVMAPGVSIRSSFKGGGYSYMSGSSMAAPYVAGIVALIRQYDPEATVSQIKNALIASAIDLGVAGEDNDYGYGFVDASIVLDYLDASGPSDFDIERINYPQSGIAEIGSSSQIEILIRSSAPITGQLIGKISAEKIAGVSIHTAEASFVFGGGGLFAYSSQPYVIELSSSIYHGQHLPFVLELGYPGEEAIEIIDFDVVAGIEPPGTIETHSSGVLELTISDFGQYGLGPESNYNTGGRGLRYRDGANLLYEAGLIVATGADQMSSSIRDSLGEFAVSDFQPVSALSSGSYGLDGGFHHTAELNATNSTAVTGLTIFQETVNFDTYEDNRFVIMSYSLRNNSASSIDGLRMGMLVDFDLPGGDEQLTYDPSLNLVYQYRASGEVVGLLGLKGVTSFSSVKNPTGSKIGFSSDEKYALISSDGIDIDEATSGDFLLVVGSGSMNLHAGGVEEVAYAVLAAPSVSDLLLAAQEARHKFDILTSITASGTAGLPVGIELRQNYPNPFNPTTTISFRLTKAERVSLDIYNLLGQKVTTLFDGNLPTGFHTFEWDASTQTGYRSASGVYFYRLSWSNGVESKKMVLVK